MSRILLIEDDADIALLAKHALEKDGAFTVTVSRNGELGLREALDQPPALVLLDLNLPGMDGLDVCRRLRQDKATASIPIIMLTARIDESDKVSGLEIGADDYITKPFSVKELTARVRAVLRRSETAPATAEILNAGSLKLDEARRRVEIDGEVLALTRKEFDLLAALLRQRGRVLTRERLLEKVWGYDHPGETRTVDVHVRQLRKKLGDAVAGCIETVVGVGYRFGETDP